MAATTSALAPLRRRTTILVLAGLLALALVAGLVLLLARPRHPDRAPFDQALDSFAAAEGISYRTKIAGAALDVRETRHGESIGTLTLAGQRFGLLSLGGRNYIRLPAGFVPPYIQGSPRALSDRWILSNTGPLAAVTQLLPAPGDLAARLRTILDKASDIGAAPAPVDNTPALVARGSAGNLYVSRDQPYRVLRYEPAGGGSTPPSLPPLPTIPSLPPLPSIPGLPSLPPIPGQPGLLLDPAAAHHDPNPPGNAQLPPAPADLTPLFSDAVDQTYNDLKTNNAQLTQSIDASVHFSGQENATIACQPAECVVTADVTDELSGGANTTVVGAQITAELTATIEVDRLPAGGCASPPTPLAANGSVELTCSDVDSAAFAQAELAEKEASTPKGEPVTVAITGQAEVQATGEAEATVEQEQQTLEQEQQDALGQRAPPAVPPTGIKVAPVSLGLRQSGVADPVKAPPGLRNPWKAPEDGLAIEAALGGNMPEGNSGVDTYYAEDGGVAVSVKTLDWRSPSYVARPSLIKNKLQGYVDDLVNFREGRYKNPTPDPKSVTVWVIQFAFPVNPPADVMAIYQAAIAYGADKGIIVQLIPVEV